METNKKLSVAAILKEKPANTRLYSPLFGVVYLDGVDDRGIICVSHHGVVDMFNNDGTFFAFKESQVMLFPSNAMRDWEKMKWERGDVLVNKERQCYGIFEARPRKGKEPECDLVPFQQVLVSDGDEEVWNIEFFGWYEQGVNYPYHCLDGQTYAQCIPYEGHEHLLGTDLDKDTMPY